MLSFLKSRTLLIVLGFLLLALFIWFAGPYFAFAEFVPLETATARLIAILVVIGGWLLWRLVKRLRANRASDQLVSAVVKQSEGEQRPSAEAAQLRERFEEAVAALKQKRRGGHSLYDLPWYVFIGAPGSGKTTALVNSGLNFPLEQRSGKGALRGVGGTRNCDWWFTDEAVFLDTAGRYTTQDSDSSADSSAWKEFLALLRKYRKRRPVNGIILTISAQDLMTQGHGGRDAYVAAARRRLNELNTELRIQLPVYVMVTKCDLVAGFTEYFDDLAQDGRGQVWGMTFPYEQTRTGKAADAYASEFDLLIERLNARLFGRLEEERDVRRRARIFGFPQQMAALRDVLGEFISEIFTSTRFDQQILLRGVYFTSGTQEGTPIDRLLGAIGRRFAVTPEAVAPPGRGKAYFIERLLKHVLLAESGLAGVNRRLEVQKAALQLGAYAAMIAIAVLGVIAFSVSYSRNRAYVEQVAADLGALQQVPPVPVTVSLESALPRLDAVRAVYESANRFGGDTPVAMRWGLYQGSSLGKAARDAYARELDGALLPRVASRFERRLVDFVSEPEKLYEYLKAYLMLGQPDRLDESHLAFIADLEWESAYGSDPDLRASVTKHFRSLLESEERLRPVQLNQVLVDSARNTIKAASVPGLMYRQIRMSYAGDTARALRLDVASGIGSADVLRRRSQLPLSDPIPSVYTKPVFEEITKRGTEDLVAQFAKDHWVWGEGGFSAVSGTVKLASDMIDVYELDYIKYWQAVLDDLDVVPFSASQTSEKLAILGGQTSPLRGFLKTVDEHTFLTKPPETEKPATEAKSRLDQIFARGKEAIGLAPRIPPGTKVTAHFQSIHRLVAAGPAGGPPPIDNVVGKIAQIQQKLAPVGDAIGQKPLDPLTSASVGEIAQSLNRDAAALPPPVAAVVTQVGKRAVALSLGSLGSSLSTRYQQDVVRRCAEAIEGRYPFTPTSSTDVALADFGEIFGPNGVFDSFFRSSLVEYVDTTRTPWRFRSDVTGSSVGIPRTMLDRFQMAERIRDAFFRGGSQTPELRFTVTPAELDATSTRFLLEVDGQNFDYRHGPERNWPAMWPGPNPGTAAATFDVRTGGRPNRAFAGPWAWFRLIDAGQLQRETDVRFMLAFEAGGQQARVRIEASSIRNPFVARDWQQFRCGI